MIKRFNIKSLTLNFLCKSLFQRRFLPNLLTHYVGRELKTIRDSGTVGKPALGRVSPPARYVTASMGF